MRVLFLSISISMLLLKFSYTMKYEDYDRLFYNLFQDYNKYSSSRNGNVSIGLSITDVVEVNGELVTFNIWQQLSWKDFRLQWSAEDYKTKSVHLPINLIWSPDIFLYNQARKEVNLADALAIVDHDGNILHITPKLVTVRCSLDKKNGEYHCNFKYASWAFHGEQIDINFQNGIESVDFNNYYGKYRIFINTGKRNVLHYPWSLESYPDVTFTIVISKSY